MNNNKAKNFLHKGNTHLVAGEVDRAIALNPVFFTNHW